MRGIPIQTNGGHIQGHKFNLEVLMKNLADHFGPSDPFCVLMQKLLPKVLPKYPIFLCQKIFFPKIKDSDIKQVLQSYYSF